MKLKFKDGNASVTMDDTLEKLVREIIEKALPGALEMVENESTAIFNEAVTDWPVATGTSKEGLNHEVVVTDSKIRAVINADADHSVYVKSFKNGLNGKSAVVELLRKPRDRMVKKILADLGPAIADLANKKVK